MYCDVYFHIIGLCCHSEQIYCFHLHNESVIKARLQVNNLLTCVSSAPLALDQQTRLICQKRLEVVNLQVCSNISTKNSFLYFKLYLYRSETQRKSWSQSPVNNPLLDSPPAARPLTLAAKSRAADNQTNKGDKNNNDYLRLSETAIVTEKIGSPRMTNGNIYENHRSTRGLRVQKTSSLPVTDHVYEVIPAHVPSFYHRMHNLADESNYLVPKTISATKHDGNKQRKPMQNDDATNLRTMRRIGRSVDSIKTVQDSKLRSRSTVSIICRMIFYTGAVCST